MMSVLALLSCGWPERGFWASLSPYVYGQVTPASWRVVVFLFLFFF